MRVTTGLLPALFLPLLFVCPVWAQATDSRVIAADDAYAAKQYKEAISLYRKVVDSDLPGNTRARALWKIAYCQYNLGDKESARASWINVADRFPEAAKYACEGLLRAGNLASAAHDLTGAIDAYGRACSDAYCQVEGAKPLAVQAMCWLGNSHVKAWTQTRVKVAEESLSGGITPDSSSVWEAALPSYRSAVDAFQRIVELFPTSELAQEASMQLIALRYDCSIYEQGSKFEDVVADADKFLDEYPGARRQLAVVWQVRGEALYALGQYDSALVNFRTVQDTYGDVAGQALGTSQYFLARCFERKGDYEQAITEFERFLNDAKPSFDQPNERAAAELAIGAMLRAQKKWDGALEALKRISTEFPGTCWEQRSVRMQQSIAREMTK